MRDLPDAEHEAYPGVGHIAMAEIPGPTARRAPAFLPRRLTGSTVTGAPWAP